MKGILRPVELSDAAAIAELYNHYIQNTTITFEITPVTEAIMLKRIQACIASYDWLVYQEAEQLLGYAYAHRFREREAYQYTCETTVYVRADSLQQGIGSLLYLALLEKLRKASFAVAVAGIALPNPGSVRLHERFGFKPAGVLKALGRKQNKWIDVGFWHLQLKDCSSYCPPSV